MERDAGRRLQAAASVERISMTIANEVVRTMQLALMACTQELDKLTKPNPTRNQSKIISGARAAVREADSFLLSGPDGVMERGQDAEAANRHYPTGRTQ